MIVVDGLARSRARGLVAGVKTCGVQDVSDQDITGRDFAELAVHGGALCAAERLFPGAPRPWLDLSTGINPIAYPFANPAREAFAQLPDAAALARLEQIAAERYRAPVHACVVAAPGTQAIIQRLPSLAAGNDVRILGPTYGEFARVFQSGDRLPRLVSTLEGLAGADIAILANPNNPDGRATAQDNLLRLAERVGILVVDEAFADACPARASLIPRLPPARVIAMRSFGKIYGLAGVRLGFAVTSDGLGETLRRMLGPWPVSGPAIAIGSQALADVPWLSATAGRLRTDGARLDDMLRQAGSVPVGSTPLFRLISHHRAPDMFTMLARSGVLVRPFREEPTWLRFGHPGNDGDWTRLGSALLACR